MPFWKNVSESTYERPGDGVHASWVAAPGDVVESDGNPSPGNFEETDQTPVVPSVDAEEGHQ